MNPVQSPQSVTQADAQSNGVESHSVLCVVQTGIVTRQSDIITFTDSDGNRCPQILRVVKNEREGNRIKGRIAAMATKDKRFSNPRDASSTPILGLMFVTVEGKKTTRVMTDEQKKAAVIRLTEARKKAHRGK